MHEMGGDGRLTQVFVSFGSALIAHPIAYLIICVLGFLPVFVATGTTALNYFFAFIRSYPSVAYTLASLFFLSFTAVVCVLSIKSSAKPRGEFLSYEDIIAALRYVPHVLLVLCIFAGSVYGWFQLARIASRVSGDAHGGWWLVWLIGYIFILFALPAFLLLFPPVFVLEMGTFSEKIKRGIDLARGFRWRILGIYFVVSIASLTFFSALMAVSISLMQWEESQRIASWIAFTYIALFWSAMSIFSSSLYTRIRHARGEINLPDIAEVFS